jgi:hypothetical protein
MRTILRALASLLLLSGVWAAFAAPPAPLRYLNADEAARLGRGETVIRSVADYRKLALSASGKVADELRASVAAIKPNYLSEVIAIATVKDDAEAEALLGRLQTALSDPRGFVGIPYWSTRNKKTYDLFDKMEIRSRAALPGGESVEVLQHMEPFDDFRARYEYSQADAALRFTGRNLDPIIYSYRNFKAVATGDMLWSLYVVRDGGRMVFYGVGAVRAFDLLGAFRDRLEASFTGRIEAFFGYMSGKMRQG